jgi:hypothetical protein
MTTFTTNYAFPKPAGTDSPDGPTQIGALADAADAALQNQLARLVTGLLLSINKAATATLTLTTSLADIAGCTTTFSVTGAHAFALVVGAFDMSKTAVAAAAVGVLVVDGSVQAAQAQFSDFSNTISDRTTVSETWIVPLAAGSRTLKLQASRTPGSGTVNANITNTTMSVLVVDLP